MDNFFFPILITYKLNESKTEILSKIYETNGYHIFEEFTQYYLTDLKKNKKMFVNLEWNQIKRIYDWNFPAILFCDEKEKFEEFKKNLFNTQISHVIFLDSAESWILPEIILKTDQKLAIICNGNHYSKLLKRLLEFAEFRVMFINDIETLEYILKEKSLSFKEILIFIDLDYNKIDPVSILQKLSLLINEYNYLNQLLHFLIMKDTHISLYNINWNTIISILQRLNMNREKIKKIFHPIEVILIVIESLYFSNIYTDKSYLTFFSLKDLLYSSTIQIHTEQTIQKLEVIKGEIQNYKKALPVMWLYEYLTQLYTPETLLLK